jgi:HD-GYP domain-containing protein (c-di-GMP phosphodiesterase class II)
MSRAGTEQAAASNRPLDASVAVLIALVAAAAAAVVVVTLPATIEVARTRPLEFAAFFVLTLGLQLLSVSGYGTGGEGVSAMGMLAAGFALGPGPAMQIAIAAAIVQWLRARGILHRAVFDAADFSLSAGAAAFIYVFAAQSTDSTALLLAGAAAAGVAFKTINTGLLCVAMALSEGVSPLAVWRERFRWASLHYLAFGPLAFVIMRSYEELGLIGLAAFSIPPALMSLSVRQYLEKTRTLVEEIRQTNEELREANAELTASRDDMRELFELASGLAARAHARDELVRYAERSLADLTGSRTRISLEVEEGAIALAAAGHAVGSLRFDAGPFDRLRWERLRDALLPQLSTALESAGLVERVRQTHLATIAALSRSIEAKDYSTGGHVERVSGLAVALARRLGYTGAELDAIEVGALLHDVGKIGIPESILQKRGPLDDDEWEIMRRHPIISEYILSEVDLPAAVRQICRSSHERIDGRGYPDGLAGDAIPMPARIVLVADAFDAMTSERPYRRAFSVDAAVAELRAHAGTQFCSTVVGAFERIYAEEPDALGAPRLRALEQEVA